MAVVIPGKLIYLAQQNTGSMAVSAALKELGGLYVAPGHVTYEEIKSGQAWIESPGAAERGPSPWLGMTGDELPVTTIRNPYDVITTWFVRSKYAGEFEEFVGGVGDRWKSAYVTGHEIAWHPAARVRMRYETLETDFATMLRGLDLRPVELPRKNVTVGKRPWASYYNQAALDIVNDRFGVEFAAMGYPRLETLGELG